MSLNITNYYILSHADKTICPPPDTIHAWFYFSNSYNNGEQYAVYYTVPEEKTDAYSFAEYCGSLTEDSNMARIFNQEENDFLTENLLIGVNRAWIGGYYQPVFTKNQTFQGWLWLDQKVFSASVPVIYENWKPGRPNDSPSKAWITIYGDQGNGENENLPGVWRDSSPDNQYNFICELRCQLEQEDDELLLDWSGEMRSTLQGDPVSNGMGVIPVLPSRFGLRVTAFYDSTDSPISDTWPLTLGHLNVCENGRKNSDLFYGPRISWLNNGNLDIYFDSPNIAAENGWSYFSFWGSTNVKNGDETTVELEIYEDKIYANYTVNGNTGCLSLVEIIQIFEF